MRVLLLVLSALILLETTDGVEYDALEEHDRKIVDEAIKKANEMHGKVRHLDFSTILHPNGMTLIVILKPTSCKASSDGVHRKNCQIQDNAKPQVSCVACHGNVSCFNHREKYEIQAALNACLEQGHLTRGASLLP